MDWQEPWLIIGDFNELANSGEKFGGRVSANRIWFLNEFMKTVGTLDLGYTGKRFIWENRQDGRAYIKEMLDHFMANKDWIHLFE